jgi:two-component system KDP operon response regulator KdpE
MTLTPEITILVVEDEPEIRKFLKVVLSSHNFKPAFAETAKEGIKLVAARPPDTIILDLGLPDMDGLEVIRKVREWSHVPIIVLSARGQEQDKVAALELGADDYLTKPFGAAELLARIKVAQRHMRQTVAGDTALIESGALKIDLEKRLVSVSGTTVNLTPTEYKMLGVLALNAGKVVTNKQLLREVWGRNSEDNNHYLRIYAQHIRRKLGDDPMQPKHIITEAGVGYRLRV